MRGLIHVLVEGGLNNRRMIWGEGGGMREGRERRKGGRRRGERGQRMEGGMRKGKRERRKEKGGERYT